MTLDPKLVRVISAVFKIPVDSVDESTSADNVELWDSLQHLNLIVKIEAAFGVRIPSQNIPKLRSARLLQEEIERLNP